MTDCPYRLYEAIAYTRLGPLWRGEDSQGNNFATYLIADTGDEDWLAALKSQTSLSHPALATAKQVHQLSEKQIAILFPYVPGFRLDLIALAKKLTNDQIRYLGYQISQALSYLHENNQVHGDISPSNILISAQGEPVLIDFISLSSDQGTPGFRAPERNLGKTAAGDVYSLAKILVHLGLEESLLSSYLNCIASARPSAQELALLLHTQKPHPIPIPKFEELQMAQMKLDGKDARTVFARKKRKGGKIRHRKSTHRTPKKNQTLVENHENKSNSQEKSAILKKTIAVKPLLTSFLLLSVIFTLLVWATPLLFASNIPHADEKINVNPNIETKNTSVNKNFKSLNPSPPTDSEAKTIFRKIIKQRDFALNNIDNQALGKVSVEHSSLWSSDQKLVDLLKNTGSKIMGFTTQIEDIEILKTNSQEIILRTSISQAPYRQLRYGFNKNISAPPKQVLIFELLAQPWRLLSVHPDKNF